MNDKRKVPRTRTTRPLPKGCPTVPSGDGDKAVQRYISAMPDWRKGVGRKIDALIVTTVPNVQKAVRWSTSFYGVEKQGWFLSLQCSAKYVKVAFLRGASLTPLPPIDSKDPELRYLYIREDHLLDEALFLNWITQSSKIHGVTVF